MKKKVKFKKNALFTVMITVLMFFCFTLPVNSQDRLKSALEKCKQQRIFLNWEDNDLKGSTIVQKLKKDELLVIYALTNVSTGFQWEIENYDKSFLKVEEMPEDDALEHTKIPGASVYKRFVIYGVGNGQSEIKLAYQRSWQKEKSRVNSVRIKVESQGKYNGGFSFMSSKFETKELKASDYQVKALPSSFDWAAQGKVTSVKDQGSCGSCWAFGATAQFEAAIKIKDNVTRDLSEQFLVSCASDMDGCGGGWWSHPYFIDKIAPGDNAAGAVYESSFPYEAYDAPCNAPYSHLEKATSWGYTDGVEDNHWPNFDHNPTIVQVKEAIYNYGPVGTAVCSSDWGSYSGGVKTSGCNTSTHIVLITGWDDANQCWIIKNSWGLGWGESGYIRVRYGVSATGYCSTWLNYQPLTTLTADFSADANRIPVGGNITFSDETFTPSGTSVTSWQWSFPGGSPSSYNGKNPPSVTYSAEGTYNVQLTVTNSAGASNTNIKTGFITVKNEYCVPSFHFGSYSHIGNVTFGTINNTTEETGVNDYSDQYVTDVDKGSVYTLSVTANVGNSGSADYIRARAWIDWNKNWVYDANELVMSNEFQASSGNRTFTESITVPTSAVIGKTAMRVIVCYKQGTEGDNPCDFMDSGESEDYGINIIGGGDTQAPSIPSNVTAGTITQTSIALNWTASTDNVGVTGYDIYRGSTFAGSSTGTTYTATGLTCGTTYSFTVRAKDAAGNVSAASTAKTVTTSACSDTQPPSVPANVTAGTITQTSIALSWTASTDNVGVTGYDIYRGSTLAGSSTGTSYTATGLTCNTSYSFTVRAKDAAGNVSGNSNTASATTLACGCNYCSLTATDQGYEWITGVTIGSFTKTSGKENGGYSNFTSETVNLTAGESVSVSLTPNTTQYTEHFKIWIDYNGDCDFEDNGEEVFTGSAQGNTTGTINVPSGLNITTRMRVAMQYNAAPPSYCGSYQYGEVEDYTVNISGGGEDTEPPSVPTGLSASGVTQTSVNLSWNASTDNIGVDGYDVLQDGSVVASPGGTSASVSGLSAGTTYSFAVRAKDAAGNVSATSTAISVTTDSGGDLPNYCVAEANAGPEHIARVQFAGIDNSSARANYQDFTTISGNVSAGSTYTLTVTIGEPYNSDNEAVAFIDWNRDGDLTDSGEKYVLSVAGGITGTASITVPSVASNGLALLRIRVSYYDNQEPCGDNSYGEVEDYAVSISGVGGAGEPIAKSGNEISVYPVPNTGNFTIAINSEVSGEVVVNVIDASGQVVAQKASTALEIPMNISVAPGIYTLQVITSEGISTKKIMIE